MGGAQGRRWGGGMMVQVCGKRGEIQMERKRFEIPEGAVDIVSGAYCLDDKTIIGIPRDVTEIVIPETVTKIGVFAFSPTFSFGNFTKLESVIIPDSVLNIGFWAFSGCSSLRSIEIPRSVTAIYNGAFDDCSSLTQIKVHPENEHFFDEKGVLFEGAKPDNSKYPRVKLRRFPAGRKAREYAIPGYVGEIGERAFDGCSSLVKVTFPDSVTRIGREAFKGCSRLAVAELPPSLRGIGDSAFEGCSRLIVPQLPHSIQEIGSSAFEGCSFLGTITIPSHVTTIGAGAFAACRTLAEIKADGGKKAFHDRDGILFEGEKLHTFPAGKNARRYTIRKGVTRIEARAFEGCAVLAEIDIRGSVEEIPNGAFRGCSALAKITIPESVRKIGGSAFSGCSALTGMNIPDSVQEIGSFAFSGCTALTKIEIPDSVQKIGSYAFSGCTSLDGFMIHPDNTVYREEDGVLFEGRILRMFPPGKKVRRYVIPDFVTEIGEEAFDGCSMLEEIEIHGGVKKIASQAFCGCSRLRSVVMSDGVEIIGNRAFEGCLSLKSVRIPESVTEIGRLVFLGCSPHEKVYVPKRLHLERDYFPLERDRSFGCPRAELVEYGGTDAAAPAVSENLPPEEGGQGNGKSGGGSPAGVTVKV